MATKKFPPFLGRETPSEERKEMKVKKQSPALYKMAEKAEGVHGKSGTMKPSKYASGGMVPDKKRMGSGAMGKGPGYAKGGGIERKGRTQGTAIKMRGGGKC
jgi:hypothetical protein